MHHAILMSEVPAHRAEYGVTHDSYFVYTGARGGVLRVTVWDNTGRPHSEHCANHWQHKASPPAYLDPMNVGTNDPVTVLIEPESVVISADTSRSTGGRNSGQRYAPDRETLRDGDTATLVFPDRDGDGFHRQDFTLHFPRHNNGHGHATPAGKDNA